MATKSPKKEREVRGTLYGNTLEGPQGIFVFALLSLCLSCCALVVCSDLLTKSGPLRLFLLQLFVIVLCLGWFAFTICDDIKSFFLAWLGACGLCASSVVMLLTQQAIAFWITLSVLAAAAVVEVFSDDDDLEENFFNSIYVLWVVVGVTITLGNTELFDYSKPAMAIREIHLFLDVRYATTAVFLLCMLIKAVVEAFRDGAPDIPPIPDPTMSESSPEESSMLRAVFRPFVILINSILKVLHLFANVVWTLIALFVTYLVRTGVNLANNFFEIISQRRVWRSIIRVVVTFVLTIGLVRIAILASPQVSFYLTNLTSYTTISFHTAGAIALTWTAGLYFFAMFAILVVCKIWSFDDFFNPTLFGGSMILIGLWLAGLVMYGLAQITQLGIVGFGWHGLLSLGVFTLTNSCVVGVVLTIQLIRRLINVDSSE